ncbi:hypothetical protein MBLNU13_g10862t1 [Cladosporium sp. NU13]
MANSGGIEPMHDNVQIDPPHARVSDEEKVANPRTQNLSTTKATKANVRGARAIQGIGGRGVITLVKICIGDLFSARERGFYYGLVGAVWGVSSAIGPVVGGVLSSKASWRWRFYINLPLSRVGLAALYIMLKLRNPRTPVGDGLKAVDWFGSPTVIGITLLIFLGLEVAGVTYS